jgi:hypothetical protein
VILGDILKEWYILGGRCDECRKYIRLLVGSRGKGSDEGPDECSNEE